MRILSITLLVAAPVISADNGAASSAFIGGGDPFEHPSESPLPEHADMFVLGRDFHQLLSDSSLKLSVKRTKEGVVFIWKSDDAAILDQVVDLGHYIEDVRQSFHSSTPSDLPPAPAAPNFSKSPF